MEERRSHRSWINPEARLISAPKPAARLECTDRDDFSHRDISNVIADANRYIYPRRPRDLDSPSSGHPNSTRIGRAGESVAAVTGSGTQPRRSGIRFFPAFNLVGLGSDSFRHSTS